MLELWKPPTAAPSAHLSVLFGYITFSFCVIGLPETIPQVSINPHVCEQRDHQREPKWRWSDPFGRAQMYSGRGCPSPFKKGILNAEKCHKQWHWFSLVTVQNVWQISILHILIIAHTLWWLILFVRTDSRSGLRVFHSEELSGPQTEDTAHRGLQWDLFQQSHGHWTLLLHGLNTLNIISLDGYVEGSWCFSDWFSGSPREWRLDLFWAIC